MNRYRSFSPEAGRPNELILLDVDGTILPDIPDELTGVAYWRMSEEGLLRSNDDTYERLMALKNQHAHDENMATRRLYLDPLVKEFDAQIAGQSRTTMDRFADELINDEIDNAYQEIITEINQWQDKGAYVGLVSGSPNFLIQALKRHLGADIATGTRFYSSGGKYHEYRGSVTRGRNKHLIAESMLIDLGQRRLHALGKGALTSAGHRPETIEEFAPEDRFSLRSSYGDTLNDHSMLEMADEPVVVNPKPDLLEKAKDNGWRVITPRHPSAANQPQSHTTESKN